MTCCAAPRRGGRSPSYAPRSAWYAILRTGGPRHDATTDATRLTTAEQQLAEVYRTFREDFDNADLQAAGKLLAEPDVHDGAGDDA